MRLILTLLLAGLLSHCTLDQPLALHYRPKLVVAGFISPQDSVVQVAVRKSYALGEPVRADTLSVPDAVVTLSDGTTAQLLRYNAARRLYEAPNNGFILANRTYWLTIRHGRYPDVDVSCHVPGLAPEPTMESDGGGTFRFRWPDDATTTNFYRIDCRFEVAAPSTAQLVASWPGGLRQSLLTDAERSGGQMTSADVHLRVIHATPNNGPMLPAQLNIDSLRNLYATVSLLNTDEPYYRYHRYVVEGESDNPFVEPSPPYTNIPGGLGCFAAYNQTTVRWRVR